MASAKRSKGKSSKSKSTKGRKKGGAKRGGAKRGGAKRSSGGGLTLGKLAREVRGIKATVGGLSRRQTRTEHNVKVLDTAALQMANVLAENWGQPRIRQFDGWQAMGSSGGGGGGGRRVGSGRRKGTKRLGAGR
jgi:hypothetical protein